MRVGGKLLKLDDLDKKVVGFFTFRDGLCEVRLPCCCFDVVSLLFTAQSEVNSRALIKQTFRDTYSESQSSGQPKLVGPPSIPSCLLMNTLQRYIHTNTGGNRFKWSTAV